MAAIASSFTGVAVASVAKPARRVARRATTVKPTAALDAQRMATPYDGYKFEPIRESQISRAMTARYMNDLQEHAEVSRRAAPPCRPAQEAPSRS